MCVNCTINDFRSADLVKARVCFHEAGHALVAQALRLGPYRIKVAPDPVLGWCGNVALMHGKQNLNGAVLACAGILAEPWHSCNSPGVPTTAFPNPIGGYGKDEVQFKMCCQDVMLCGDTRVTGMSRTQVEQYAWGKAWNVVSQVAQGSPSQLFAVAHALFNSPNGIVEGDQLFDLLQSVPEPFVITYT